ncbi:acetyl-CoA carboxylase biotin carboxylase subunit family protein [Nonomuraea sp. NPDC049028]|uniref:ATP-grasp domain-containing protein n=1 Tax=Nonomuraea sp. NPDC049028 TaxID=3364348 RepID=UPI003720D5DC
MRLFVIGADPRREWAFSTWLRAGLSVTLADGVSGGGFEHAVDRFHPVEVRDEKADVESLVRMAASHDGVTTLAEGSLITAATVARELGLPGPGVGAARIARSKIRQRWAGQRHGLTGPRHSAVTGPDDLVRFFAAGVQAAVLKPPDASASAAVFAVHSVEEALDRWPRVRAISPSRTGIVEEYLPGAEASVEAVVRGGELVFSSLTRKQTGGPTGFLEVAHTTDQAERPDAAVSALVHDLIAAWQVESAILHVEVKLDGGRPVLLEGTIRPAGDYITELVSAVHGRDLYLDQAHLALGRPLAADRPPRARRAEVRFLLASGIVRRNVAPVEVLAGLPDVKIVRQLAAAGCRLPPLTANWARAGYALGWSTDDGESLTGQLRTAVTDLGKLMGTPELA